MRRHPWRSACPARPCHMTIQDILFDLDGTLVDSLPGVEFAARAAWEAVQPGPPCPSMRRLMGPPIQEMFRRAVPGADASTLGALVRAFRATYDNSGWQKTVPFPGVSDALKELTTNGIRCFVVTNKPSVSTQRILDHCGLSPFFTEVASLDSRTPPFASKTDATQMLVAGYHIDRSQAVLMGDTIEDAHVAQVCGLRFVAFRGGYGWPDLTANLPTPHVCDRFEDLLALLRNIPTDQ
jgi:phosphoglycolate phosphatase